MFATSSAVVAQAHTSKVGTQLMDVPKGPFVGPQAAINRLDVALGELKTQMLSLTPGTQSHDLVNWKYVYFHAVRDRITEGKSVPEGIIGGLGVYFTDAYGSAPEQQQMANKNAVIALLSV
jgi:hypothetical protein